MLDCTSGWQIRSKSKDLKSFLKASDKMSEDLQTNQSVPKTNLIVNYLPQNLTDQQFQNLFSSIGPITTARIIRDKSTGYSYGYGFVDFQRPEDAAEAIVKLDKYQMHHKYIKVAYSKPSGTQTKNINLYVTGLASDCTEELLRTVFSKYGSIVQCNVIKDKTTKLCQGICFVLYACRDQAQKAISQMNGRIIEGLGDKPITIKYAKNEQRTQANPFVQSFNRNSNFIPPNHPYLLSHCNLNGIRGIRMPKDRYSNILPPSHLPDTKPYFKPTFNNEEESHSKVVFVYGIGPYTTEDTLYHLFGQFGNIQSVNVVGEPFYGSGKGYGFVTYSTEREAEEAVRCLDKYHYQGRSLQVSIKNYLH